MKIDQEIYKKLLDESSDPIFSFYPDGTYRYVNQAFAKGVAKSAEDIIGKKIWDIFPQEEADKRYAAVKYVFEKGVEKVIEVKVEVGNNVAYYLTTVKPSFDEAGKVSTVICISKNITERKNMEEKLKYYATTDSLTGVVNRRTGISIFEKLYELSKRAKIKFSICFIDINDLKYVNDKFGHIEGDFLISKVSDTVKECIRQMDTLCRMGGDEFLVLLPECDKINAEMIWDRFLNKIEEFNVSEHKPYQITLSHGIVEYNTDSEDTMETLLFRADKLMYEEKNKYKNGLK